MKAVGESVRWRRKTLGMSQGELAALIRVHRHPVTQPYISRIETGRIDPPLSAIRSLAKALRLKPWQLLVGLNESDAFWCYYLELKPEQKRDIQHHIKFLSERRES
jgi:transcriptional regulator with XRE-family HTH domain